MKSLFRALFVTTALAGPWLLSCSADDPTRVDRPPVIQGFSPSQNDISAFVGDTLLFTITAMDPDRGALSHFFTLDDSVVSSRTRWEYAPEDTGDVRVRGLISDGSFVSTVEWRVRRHVPINLPPAIVFFSPADVAPRMIIGSTLRFIVEAHDPNNDELQFTYMVDDTVRSDKDELVYSATSIGDKAVRVFVSDGENTVIHDWALTVTGVPDTLLPAPVVVTKLETGTDPGEIDIEWTAVGRNGMEGMASIYRIRTSPQPIKTEYDWVRASPRANVPVPLPAGETMKMTINDLIPAGEVYVAVRAEDDFGNVSRVANSPGTFSRGMRISGIVRNSVTNEPMPGVHVRVGWYNTLTGTDGTFEFVEMPPIDNLVYVSDDNDDTIIGEYYDFIQPYVVKHLDYLSLFLIPEMPLLTTNYDDFYQFYRALTDLDGSPSPSGGRRWELPIDLYVKPYFSIFDYKATIEEVAREFDAILGEQVFNVVDSIPDVGVWVEYSSQVTQDRYNYISFDENWFPIQGKIVHRVTYPSPGNLRIIARHELGHAIGLQHSTDPIHVMLGGSAAPTAAEFTTDEINVIKTRYHLPRGLDLLYFRRR